MYNHTVYRVYNRLSATRSYASLRCALGVCAACIHVFGSETTAAAVAERTGEIFFLEFDAVKQNSPPLLDFSRFSTVYYRVCRFNLFDEQHPPLNANYVKRRRRLDAFVGLKMTQNCEII